MKRLVVAFAGIALLFGPMCAMQEMGSALSPIAWTLLTLMSIGGFIITLGSVSSDGGAQE